MALFTDRVWQDYAPQHMPKPVSADGPWGEAINYWMNVRNMRQADLARATGIEPKTISSIARGFHTTTRMLERIAEKLDVPLDAVLVSPDRKSANEARKQMILEITESVVRKIEQPKWPAPPAGAVASSPAPPDTHLVPNGDAIQIAKHAAIAAEEQRRAALRKPQKPTKRKTGSRRQHRRFRNN